MPTLAIEVLDANAASQTIATADAVIAQLASSVVPVGIGLSGNIGIPTATVWNKKLQWPIPAGKNLLLQSAHAAATIAGTRTFIGVGQKLATFNIGSGASGLLTDGGSIAAPRHYDRLFAVVTTVIAVANTNISITFNDDANVSRSSSLVITTAQGAVGNVFEVSPAAAGGIGFRDITGMTDPTTSTGVIELWGLQTVLESLAPANTLEQVLFPQRATFPAGESVYMLFNAAAVTAMQRQARVLGALEAV